ncbi:MAG: hypothetical protein JWR26_2705 [Pedosphaera sp.]|nr:hypothetical protein [Pedosphaera sp.]
MKRSYLALVTFATCLVAGFGSIHQATAQSSDPLINALVTKGILTEAEAKKIQAEVASPTNQTGITKYVLPRGNESKIKLEGFLQGNAELGDAASFEGRFTGGPNQVSPRMRLRRARIGVIGEFLTDFDFKLEGDFQQGDGLASGRTGFSGTDLFINWHTFPEANIKFGQYIAPFGYEMLLPDSGPGLILLTAERSLATISMVPERQVGAQIWGKPLANLSPTNQDLFSYAVGVFNGNNRNTTINDNSQFMYVGRVESVPFTGKIFDQPAKWRFGANVLESRDATGTLLSHIGTLKLNPDGSLSPFTTTGPDERLAWGLDQTLTIGPFEVTAEYLSEKVRATSATPILASFPTLQLPGNKFTANGYYVQPSYFVWGKKLQLVGKWESFNPGQASNDTIKSVTGGLNWYIYDKNVVAMINYIHTWSDFRRDNAGIGKDQFNEILLRIQMYF